MLLRLLLAFAVAIGLSAFAMADEMLIVRSGSDFEETMSTLQASIAAHGYIVSRVQRVDVGLEAKGYQTDKYRVVFYGKADEVKALADMHPGLIPFLPLSVATNRPRALKTFFPSPELAATFDQWEKDLVDIFDEIRKGR
jgi:uncharacterized protein (DUF302 family)